MKHSVYSLLLSLEASLWLCWEICSSFRLSDYFYWFSKVTFPAEYKLLAFILHILDLF